MTVKRNVLAGWFSHLLLVLIGFFLMPYILGTVGESQYGAWLFINAIAGYSGMVYAGFGATICRYVADHSARNEWAKVNQVVSSIQAVYSGAALLVLGLMGTFAWSAPHLDKWGSLPAAEIQIAILIVGASIALGMVCSVYGGVLIGTQRLDIKRGIEVICGLTRLLLTIICLQSRYGLVTLALIFLAVSIVENLASAWFAYRQLPTLSVGPWHVRRNVLSECFGFSAFNAVALVAEQLIYFTDTVVIGFILGPAAVVPYQIGLRIAQMIQVPIAQVGEAVLPKTGELHARRQTQELGKLVSTAMGFAFLFAGGFFIGASYFGEILIETWIGRLYADSALVLSILVGAQIVSMPMVIVRKSLLGMGEVRVPAFIDLLEAVLNLGLSLVLIRFWGIVGVAWGTVIPLLVIELFVFLPYALKRLELAGTVVLRQIVGPQLPAILALFLFCEFAQTFVSGTGWIPIFTVSFSGGCVLAVTRFATHVGIKFASLTSPAPTSPSS